jgi:hypothetical protein
MGDSYSVDARELLNWANYLEEIPKVTSQAIANGLNNYGEIVARQAAEEYAEKSDLQASEVYNSIVITPATARRLEWRMDLSALKASTEDLARPIGGRADNQFRDQELVTIVMTHDARGPCEVCEEAAAMGPYTQAQIDIIAHRWRDFNPPRPVQGERTNLLHPNCRCIVTPYANKRRLRVTYGAKGVRSKLYTGKQLGEAVANELRVSIKAVRKK